MHSPLARKQPGRKERQEGARPWLAGSASLPPLHRPVPRDGRLPHPGLMWRSGRVVACRRCSPPSFDRAEQPSLASSLLGIVSTVRYGTCVQQYSMIQLIAVPSLRQSNHDDRPIRCGLHAQYLSQLRC